MHRYPLLLVALITGAVSTGGIDATAGGCDADVARYCPGIEAGDGRLSSCLGETHIDQIGEPCRQALKRVFLVTQPPGIDDDDCLDAVQRLCFDQVLLGGELAQCLDELGGDLDPACREQARGP